MKKIKIISMNILKDIYRIITMFLFDPLPLLAKWRAIPSYLRNALRYTKLNNDKKFNISLPKLYFTTADKYSKAGSIRNHYFYQDIWAAKKIYEFKVTKH